MRRTLALGALGALVATLALSGSALAAGDRLHRVVPLKTLTLAGIQASRIPPGLKTTGYSVNINTSGPNRDQYINFFKNKSAYGFIKWIDAESRFLFSDQIAAAAASDCTGDYCFGVEGYGQSAGGYFAALPETSTGVALLGSGDLGVLGQGNDAGAYFADSDDTGYAYVGSMDDGVEAYGGASGIYAAQTDSDGTTNYGYGYLGTAYPGTDGTEYFGVMSYGATAGAYFGTPYIDEGFASLGQQSIGSLGIGPVAGGWFESLELQPSGDPKAAAYLGFRETTDLGSIYIGTRSGGVTAGGYFEDFDSTAYAFVAYDSFMITGNGTAGFTQNHPEQKDKVIVYAAAQGDEVATYTRGTGRLAGGVAHVALPDTFSMVTNPDVGLTAHLTPRGGWADLYVESMSTKELVVRARDPQSNAAFDFIAYGLRIGFEDMPTVQPKAHAAPLPRTAQQAKLLQENPGLRETTAAARFAAMAQAAGMPVVADTSAAEALKQAINAADEGKVKPAQTLDTGKLREQRQRAPQVKGPSRTMARAAAQRAARAPEARPANP